jgi:hypothetical protein
MEDEWFVDCIGCNMPLNENEEFYHQGDEEFYCERCYLICIYDDEAEGSAPSPPTAEGSAPSGGIA